MMNVAKMSGSKFVRRMSFFLQLLLIYSDTCGGTAEGDVILDHQDEGAPREGFVDVFLEGELRKVSADGFDQSTATVICREAGFAGEATPHEETYYGPLPPAWKIKCSGEEDTLLQCDIAEVDYQQEDHSVSYEVDAHFWRTYTGAYVECNEATMPITTIVIMVVLFLVVLSAVIIFAFQLHRCIVRRELTKFMNERNVPMQSPYTALNRHDTDVRDIPRLEGTSFSGRPTDTSAGSGGTDTDTTAAHSYSQTVHVESSFTGGPSNTSTNTAVGGSLYSRNIHKVEEDYENPDMEGKDNAALE